jgi:hypothetical protein
MVTQKCPNCGRDMQQVSLPQTPPWLCAPCGQAFWECELVPEARSHYRPTHRDWGHDVNFRRVLNAQRAWEAHA